MKHATEYLTFETPHRRDYVNITDRVETFVRESGIQHGLVLVNPMHITAAVYVNDAESGLIQDIDDWLERLAPHEPVSSYRHNRGEDNADAHLKRHLMSHQVVLPITDGRLDLGPWEAGLLRRVRRPPPQARRPQGDRRVVQRGGSLRFPPRAPLPTPGSSRWASTGKARARGGSLCSGFAAPDEHHDVCDKGAAISSACRRRRRAPRPTSASFDGGVVLDA